MKVVRTDVQAKLDADDVKTLLTGRPWKVESLHGGADGTVSVTYQIPPEVLRVVGKDVVTSLQKLVKSANGHAPLLLESGKPGPKPGPKPERSKLSQLSGDCPYCDSANLKWLASHVRTHHPGKPVMVTGGLKCPKCPARFPTTQSMGIHTRHLHKG